MTINMLKLNFFTIPDATSLSIGNLNNGNFINGTISSIRYFKKRLANAKLITLTT